MYINDYKCQVSTALLNKRRDEFALAKQNFKRIFAAVPAPTAPAVSSFLWQEPGMIQSAPVISVKSVFFGDVAC